VKYCHEKIVAPRSILAQQDTSDDMKEKLLVDEELLAGGRRIKDRRVSAVLPGVRVGAAFDPGARIPSLTS
jgi:hypothetical protein